MSFLDKLKGVLKPKDKSKVNSESTKNMGVNHSETSKTGSSNGVATPKKPSSSMQHSGAQKTDGIFRESEANGQSEEDITRALVLDDLEK